ncbi:MAG: hypothetical protein KAX65_03265 [Caldilineaceae bacterium]|nr:hypothetical protein [Caldilineaceae bacterium]
MTRDEYLLLLAEAVERGAISEDDARQLLALFDAGQLDPSALPLPTGDALATMRTPVDADEGDGNEALAALLLLLALLGMRQHWLGRQLDSVTRRAARDVLRLEWERTVARLAQELAATGNVATWHAGMTAEIRRYYLRQMTAGLGRSLTAAELGQLEAVLEQQAGYLLRFASDAGHRLALGNPLSEGYLTQRSRMYGGQAWSLWHQGNEAGEDQPGWVSQYLAQDDAGTCSPCSAAQGYYLPGTGPWPGEICDGGSNCRCERFLVYAPEIYRNLGGG